MANKKTRAKSNQYFYKNPIEAVRDVGSGVVKSMTSDLGKDLVSDLWDQLLGVSESPSRGRQGDMAQGEEINLSQMAKKARKETERYIEPAINWRNEIVHAGEKTDRQVSQEVSVKIQEIVIELKRLTASSQELQTQFKYVTAEQRISKPGKYHLTFFEFMLAMVRSARMKIESSGAWLSASQSKKSKKGYWNQFKKHGTSFGLSNERVVATQTG